MSIHFILGGARSGKSRHAEKLALESGQPVSVIVTAEALDDEMTQRIRHHQHNRPADWHTIEAPLQLAATLTETARPSRCIIVDCLTLWLSNTMSNAWKKPRDACLHMTPCVQNQREKLLETLPGLPGTILLVANEVGLGLVPDTPLGRLFRDEAGRLNQAIAAQSDRVTFVAAGLALSLKG